MDRNLSLGNIKLELPQKKESDFVIEQINEEEEGKKEGDENKDENASNEEESNPTVENEPDFKTLSEEIDQFLASLSNPEQSNEAPKIPKLIIDKFLDLVSKKIEKYQNGDEKWVPELEDLPLLPSVDRVQCLTTYTEKFSTEPDYLAVMNQAGGILHQTMAFLEEEFQSLLLEDPHGNPNRGSSFGKSQDPDRCVLPPVSAENDGEKPKELSLPYPCDTIDRLRDIARSMISAGYITECCQVYSLARRNAFEASLLSLGYEKPSIDDVIKMAWDPLEGQTIKWIKVFKHVVTTSFPCEREIAVKVFPDENIISSGFFHNLVREVILHLLNFPEAMYMTKRSAEKLFKMLDIYDALRDSEPVIKSFFPSEEGNNIGADPNSDLKSEIASVRSHIGESAVEIFCDLERSIKADTEKTPVPGGAVHPLTRYVMNYLKYACDQYKSTLEEVFKQNHNIINCENDEKPSENGSKNSDNPFAVQLIKVMDLLNSNLEGRSKLYKDPSLNYIFLMNNGRYIVQKIKSSTEISLLIGDTWGRSRSAKVRQYYKNYQRETWSRVLDSLKNDGLMVKGSVHKPILKERFKSFNALFEEIHRTQSAWVVIDEQLKSELKVSITALVVSAYRSFKGRFEQTFTAGRQTEKYIKFSAEDLEKYIEDLFEGNQVTIARRR
ncbi:hypothetical protein LUZ60_007492 [Juncus effusus]|nr:hypothetical protein LUZ60_007492 [Juncus effusus]